MSPYRARQRAGIEHFWEGNAKWAFLCPDGVRMLSLQFPQRREAWVGCVVVWSVRARPRLERDATYVPKRSLRLRSTLPNICVDGQQREALEIETQRTRTMPLNRGVMNSKPEPGATNPPWSHTLHQPRYLEIEGVNRNVHDGGRDEKRTIALPMSTKKKDLELDAWFSGRVEPLDFRNERRPPVCPSIDQTKSGEHLPR